MGIDKITWSGGIKPDAKMINPWPLFSKNIGENFHIWFKCLYLYHLYFSMYFIELQNFTYLPCPLPPSFMFSFPTMDNLFLKKVVESIAKPWYPFYVPCLNWVNFELGRMAKTFVLSMRRTITITSWRAITITSLLHIS